MTTVITGAEGAAVLVGAVNFLDKPALGFVRLKQATILAQVTEIPIPVRFLFLLLGPINAGMDYHEVGRSISTLLSNRVLYNFGCRIYLESYKNYNDVMSYSLLFDPPEE